MQATTPFGVVLVKKLNRTVALNQSVHLTLPSIGAVNEHDLHLQLLRPSEEYAMLCYTAERNCIVGEEVYACSSLHNSAKCRGSTDTSHSGGHGSCRRVLLGYFSLVLCDLLILIMATPGIVSLSLYAVKKCNEG